MGSWKSRNRQTIDVGAEGTEPEDREDRDDNLIAIPDRNPAVVPRFS
jgi:hypothetical protein